jgi:hypothetical protein
VFNVPLGLGDSVSELRGRRGCSFKTLIQKAFRDKSLSVKCVTDENGKKVINKEHTGLDVQLPGRSGVANMFISGNK